MFLDPEEDRCHVSEQSEVRAPCEAAVGEDRALHDRVPAGGSNHQLQRAGAHRRGGDHLHVVARDADLVSTTFHHNQPKEVPASPVD